MAHLSKLLFGSLLLTTCLPSVAREKHHDVLRDLENNYMPENGFYVAGDFLYWKAQEDGLDAFARTTPADGNALLTPKINDNFVHLNFKYKPGGRAKVGYIFGDEDQWDASVRYTRMNGEGCAAQEVDLATFVAHSNMVAPDWFPFFLGSMARAGEATWNLQFNVFDATLAKNCYISPKVTIKPHAGARAAWIKQQYAASYKAVFSQTVLNSATNIPVEQLTGVENDINTSYGACMSFKGGGVRIGADLVWHFNDNFSFVGEGSASLLYGKFNVVADMVGVIPVAPNETTIPANGLVPFTIHFTNNCMSRVRTNIDTFAGLGWESWCRDDNYRISIIAGYELSEWFNQNQLSAFAGSRDGQLLSIVNTEGGITTVIQASNVGAITVQRQGDLGLQGLTFKVEFNF